MIDNVDTLRASWEQNKTYCVAPYQVQATLHLLLRGAQFARSPEEAQDFLAKAVEVLEWMWPTGKAIEMTAITYGPVHIVFPKP